MLLPAQLSIEEDEVPPVHDPLGLAPGDLRITQELYITGEQWPQRCRR